MALQIRTAIFDIEGDGLLDEVTTLHCLDIRDYERGTKYHFVKNKNEDTIQEGLTLLENAEFSVGHNIVGFDIPAIEKLYPTFQLKGRVRDTLIYCQMLFADQKEKDFGLYRADRLPGKLIGRHTLEAWGYRLGAFKGDYAKEREALGKSMGITDPEDLRRFVWGAWNEEMSRYCEQDVEATTMLWHKILHEMRDFPEQPILDEHLVHNIMGEMQQDGFPFDIEGGKKLAAEIEETSNKLKAEAEDHFGSWYTAEKRKQLKPAWITKEDADNDLFVKIMSGKGMKPQAKKEFLEFCEQRGGHIERVSPSQRKRRKEALDYWWSNITFETKREILHKARELAIISPSTDLVCDTYGKADPKLGEDDSRQWWGVVETSKKTRNVKNHRTEKNGKVRFYFSTTEGATFCRIKRKDFNPTSRAQIIDRFSDKYNWMPVDFTDKGNPIVNDTTLRAVELHDKVGNEMAIKLAEVFYHEKRLGQIQNGPQAWLKVVKDDGHIRCRTNAGGTVTGRCAHSGPNLGQVPAVQVEKVQKDGTVWHKDILLQPGQYEIIGGGKKALLKGRPGDHGYDCRSLFYVPEPYKLVGCDLAGIEFRCLAELTSEFDDGALIETVLHGDVHDANWKASGVDTRDIAKRSLYALMYGAGDWKLGHTAYPQADDSDKAALGREIRDKLMKGLPALAAAIKKIQRQAESGFLIGLDGRKLYVRSSHSALNTSLQSAAALIAKRWVVNIDNEMLNRGYVKGWGNDWALLAFIHDETQSAVKKELAQEVAKIKEKAAMDAGHHFNFRCPVDAESKIGMNWKETH